MSLTNDLGMLINLIAICDRVAAALQHCFHVCGEWVPISHKCDRVLYEWVLINKQHEDVGHKCDRVLYGWNDFCDEREFGKCVTVSRNAIV